MEDDKIHFKAIEYLLPYINAPITGKTMILLSRAVTYADIYLFVENPKSQDEVVKRDIFLIKAKSYYSRNILNPYKDQKQIDYIREYEVRSVHILKARLQYI